MIHVVIIEDHPITRAGLRDFINAQPDLAVAAATADGAEGYASVLSGPEPCVVLLDLNLPDMSGWTLLERIVSLGGEYRVIVLSVRDENMFCRRLLKAGAWGYLMKGIPLDEVARAIRLVAGGNIAVSPEMATIYIREAIDARAGVEEEETPLDQLSKREFQVLDAIGRGLPNREIAEDLNLSEKTVATYKARIMRKLGVRTTPDLLAAAAAARRE